MPQVIFVDDEPEIRSAVAQGLSLRDLDVACYENADQVLRNISPSFDGVVISDIRMPGTDGLDLLHAVVEIDPDIPVVLATGYAEVPLAVKAMQEGAYDFVEKPFAMADLASIVGHAMEKRRLVLENRNLREALADRSGLERILVGQSDAMQQLRAEVTATASANVDVLLWGETGTGKEVVAKAIHQFGGRPAGPFVAINCGALPAEIIESELFGHERGAFTGAVGQRIGKLEHANGGTVFLDEIESMPLDLQVKLLRVLETRSLERLGANTPIPLDIRIVAATKQDLVKASEEGRFRADLYYRLNVVVLRMPELRQHREDIPELVAHLAQEAAVRYQREVETFDPAVIADLMAREWPGNVRELRNTVDRMVLGIAPSEPTLGENLSLAQQVEACEKRVIAATLAANGGRLKESYLSLGLSRKTLYHKMVRYGLRREDYLTETDV
ncbi:MAG: sigma-54 dependent transcriptional regulator [Pseudomonadota bacterium]